MTARPTWEKPLSEPPRATFRLASLAGLRDAMVANGYMSGYSLAKAARLNATTVNHLVHGRRNRATARVVHALREVLGRDLEGVFVPIECTKHGYQARHAGAPR